MRRISLFRLIATENPSETKKLLAEYGVTVKGNSPIQKIQNATTAMKKLSESDAKFREKMVAIHPHKTLFDTVHNKETKKLIEERDHYSNMVDEMCEEQETIANDKLSFEANNYRDNDYASADAIKAQNLNVRITNVALGVGIGLGFAIMLGALVKMYTPTFIPR